MVHKFSLLLAVAAALVIPTAVMAAHGGGAHAGTRGGGGHAMSGHGGHYAYVGGRRAGAYRGYGRGYGYGGPIRIWRVRWASGAGHRLFLRLRWSPAAFISRSPFPRRLTPAGFPMPDCAQWAKFVGN